ncbi:hypothetical protein FACS1894172_15230 [Spirochaetia bacterium]|nr:hypothetical protein FACS1894164_04080 [Spirochaetia bacterium]GHU34652.1 hypothetical protein FACS1894172_15230 [Spirochaetia bacterium]
MLKKKPNFREIVLNDVASRDLPGNELIPATDKQLPANIRELSKYILIGRRKLDAIRSALDAAKRTGFDKETLDKMQAEGREYGELILDAELEMASRLRAIPKASGRPPEINGTDVKNYLAQPTKSEAVAELGFSQKEAERIQKLTPEAVEAAKAEARQKNEIPTRSLALKLVKKQAKAADPVKPAVPAPEIREIFTALNGLIYNMKKTELEEEAKTRLLDLLTEAKVLLTKSTAKS